MPLHSDAKTAHGRVNAGVPGFIGRKLLKCGFQCVFKNAHVLFWAGIGCVRLAAELPASQAGQGVQADCSNSEGFTPSQRQPSEGEAGRSCSEGA